MKKLLFVVALGAFAACGTGKPEETTVDSAKIADSLAKVAAADSIAKAATDTTHKVDSTAKADSSKKK